MGFYDYITDLYSSLTIQDTLAESDKQFEGPTDTSGEQSKGSDTNAGGISTTQQRGGAAVKGGVSAGPGPSGTDEESAAEAEVNKEDLNKGGSGEGVKGHVAGEGGHSSGQRDTDSAGPHGGPLGEKAKNDAKGTAAGDSGAGDDEEEAGGDDDEEEEEEEDEPEDLKPKLEEECMKSQQCAPLKHHYDECAERVTQEQEETGKATEDCVEEFFHLMHCAAACAAPKLWRQLK